MLKMSMTGTEKASHVVTSKFQKPSENPYKKPSEKSIFLIRMGPSPVHTQGPSVSSNNVAGRAAITAAHAIGSAQSSSFHGRAREGSPPPSPRRHRPHHGIRIRTRFLPSRSPPPPQPHGGERRLGEGPPPDRRDAAEARGRHGGGGG